MLPKKTGIETQTLALDTMQDKNIQLQVLRLDKINPVVSGNKIFKLHYFLQDVINNSIITFGGAYSNHLVAAAFACKEKSIRCIGVVRGERPAQLSHSLQHCIAYGMQLHFTSREEYDKKGQEGFIASLKNIYGNCTIIPEGGYGEKGAAGAAEIMHHIEDDVTHICCAVGTATTVAGLLLKAKPQQQVIAIPVLKGLNDLEQRVQFLTAGNFNPACLHIETNYHFNGYAKKTPALIDFMNNLYQACQLPTDFVYTGKMMFAVMDLLQNNFFPPGSKICCIHTGGLQGNLSLQKNTLTF